MVLMKKVITLKNSLSESKVLEAFLESMANFYKIDDSLYANMIIATMEAFSNAYLHGNRKDPQKNIMITFEETAEWFSVRVRDEGEGFDYNACLSNIEFENGLFIILKVTDKVVFHDQGREIEMRFNKLPLNDVLLKKRKNILEEHKKHGTQSRKKRSTE